MRVTLGLLTLLAVGGALLSDTANAQTKLEGTYCIDLMSGRPVEGEVTQNPDGSYSVKTKYGIVVQVRRNEMRAIRRIDNAASTTPQPTQQRGRPTAGLRREITDAEIEELLSGIVARPDEALGGGAARDDLMAPLPLDADSLREMMRSAGVPWKEGVPPEEQDNVLIRDHFVMVYTSTPQSARELGSRVEHVWRWNVKFAEQLNLPTRRPDSKLELYYFGDYEEYNRYSLNRGMPVSENMLGYYMPDINRSHFFDMATAPSIRYYRERLEAPDVHWRDRQFILNQIRRYVEHLNVETIQHEIGHHIHFNIGLFPSDGLERESPIPIWLVEGTTMLFEVPPSQAGAGIGVLNHDRLFDLRRRFGEPPLSAEQWRMLIIDNNYWFGAGGWDQAESYYLGWALVNYLWNEHRAGYAKYLRQVFGREDALSRTELENEFIQCFGQLDEKWFEAFFKYLEGLSLKPSLVIPVSEDAARQQNLNRGSGRRDEQPEQNQPRGGGSRGGRGSRG